MARLHRRVFIRFFTIFLCIFVTIIFVKLWPQRAVYTHAETNDAQMGNLIKKKVKQSNSINAFVQENSAGTVTFKNRNVEKRNTYELFQPTEEVDFPTVEAHAPRIPHIIHQMYTTKMIPTISTELVKSFIKNNPTWQYRFWTYSSGRKLLEKHHPYLLKVYDQFGNNVKRADLLRYAVLYEYGGLYADLDVENLRSLNRSTMKYACVVSVEPFEHSVFMNHMKYLISNAIMSCGPKHPFFKQLLQNLQHASPLGNPVETTGPGYITRQFNHYNRLLFNHPENKTDWSSNSPYFYKGSLKEDDNNAVYVPNSQYFMDNVGPTNTKNAKRCDSMHSIHDHLTKRACAEYHARKIVRKNKKYTFTVHYWHHLWSKKLSDIKATETINICNIVPKCILYNGENVTKTNVTD